MKRVLKISMIFTQFVFLISSLKSADFSALTIRGYNSFAEQKPCIQLLLVYYDGKRLGFDKTSGLKHEISKEGYIYTKSKFTEIPLGTYEYEDAYGGSPCYEIDIANPPQGLYTLHIIGIDNGIYCISMIAFDKDGNDVQMYFSGIISKGEEHHGEIIYSPYPFDTSRMKKIVTIELLKNQLKNAFKYKFIKNKKIKSPLLKKLNKVDKLVKLNQKENVKKELQEFISILEQEKSNLITQELEKGQNYSRSSQQDKIILPIDILITDVNNFLANF